MLVKVVQNVLHPPGYVSTKLRDLDVHQGMTVGASFAAALARSYYPAHAEVAVDEWIGRFPALKELDEEEVWFRPMMDTVAQRLMERPGFGRKASATFSALLSMANLATDVNMVRRFSMGARGGDPERELGDVMIVLLGCLIASQLSVFWIRSSYRSSSGRASESTSMLIETTAVLAGLQPALMAFRLCRESNPSWDTWKLTEDEMVFNKTPEM